MDRDTVETHLMIIRTWASFALEKDHNFFEPAHLRDIARWMDDALELLKEQDEKKKQILKAVWDVLHEGVSTDTVADQDWVYEQIRNRVDKMY